jgi:molecular chaperone DnaK (HSP70)
MPSIGILEATPSVGIETQSWVFTRLVDRNIIIPISLSHFTIVMDNQTEMDIQAG